LEIAEAVSELVYATQLELEPGHTAIPRLNTSPAESNSGRLKIVEIRTIKQWDDIARTALEELAIAKDILHQHSLSQSEKEDLREVREKAREMFHELQLKAVEERDEERKENIRVKEELFHEKKRHSQLVEVIEMQQQQMLESRLTTRFTALPGRILKSLGHSLDQTRSKAELCMHRDSSPEVVREIGMQAAKDGQTEDQGQESSRWKLQEVEEALRERNSLSQKLDELMQKLESDTRFLAGCK
jgi:hypothetical protein